MGDLDHSSRQGGERRLSAAELAPSPAPARVGTTSGRANAVTYPNPGNATNYDTFGILTLTLHPSSYDWQFVPASDGQPGRFKDSGSGSCA
jgi:hypothetical protein